MTQTIDPGPVGLGKLPAPLQWVVLLAASAVLSFLLGLVRLPAALLLGPMLAGIVAGIYGGSIRMPRLCVIAAQTVIGCLVARAITREIVVTFLADWPLFLAVVVAILATSAAIGWILTRRKVFPGTTAVWGSAPGGASAMMLMAGEFGADPRLVAFMQYFRVVLVAVVATVVARVWMGASGAAQEIVWFPPPNWLGLAATFLVAGLGGAAGVMLRIPAGAMLVPMVAGALLEATGLVAIDLPPWLLAGSYALAGWSIGLGFTREILARASRALPQVLLANVVLIGLSGVLAVLLVYAAGIDPLTAYLATSPGGMDSVAIIGAASNADLSFVMALQTLRLIIVLIAGPPLAKLVARRMA
jgi:membrane AbrB-like protein